MAKKFFRRWLPDPHKIQGSKYLRIFGPLLHRSNLWHLNRHSVARAFSIGLFCAALPIPFHMPLSAALAIYFQANLALSIALVWLVNPITMVPFFLFAYKLGSRILGSPIEPFHFEMTLEWFRTSIHLYEELFLGCVILGAVASLLSNIFIRILWRWSVSNHWKKRHNKRLNHPPTMA